MPDLSWLTEPVRLAATIKAVITLLTIAGIALNTSQQDAIQNFATAGVALASIFGVFDWIKLRNQVTPAQNPVVEAGTPVVVTQLGEIMHTVTV